MRALRHIRWIVRDRLCKLCADVSLQGYWNRYHLRAGSEELRNRWLETLREGWTPAVVQAGMGFDADDDGRSAEARRYKSMRFSDGGTVANNPTFIALLEAWALYGAPGSSLHEFVGRQVVFALKLSFERQEFLDLYSWPSQRQSSKHVWTGLCRVSRHRRPSSAPVA